MIGKLLVDSGLDPLIFVGGNVTLFDGGAYRFGDGNYAVVEADEYDRSFLTLKPDIAVITNIDEDHMDIYKDIDDIKKTFRLFCEGSKKNGKIVYYGDDENTNDSIGKINNNKISYGFGEGNYLKIKNFNIEGEHLRYSIVNSISEYNNISLNLIGIHNVLNSAACFAVSKIMNIDFDVFKNSISGFKTVDRRLQLRYDSHGIKVFDDYAHHPKEIASSLKGLKEVFKNRKLITVFQPHLFSRTRDFYKDFANELYNSDEILLLDIYPAREKPIEGITSKLIYNELKKLFANVKYYPDKHRSLSYLLENVSNGDIIVFQGAGDVTELCSEFIKELDLKNK
jgi:UDP-N-acetylmuramate--alanine ligase